mmetsp:Transcript_49375/g.56878  ORF Transcript_49375/g.56878 Transcript_49375/m.56878 type:complete len:124 (+) Transcript_49375:175-546(+)
MWSLETLFEVATQESISGKPKRRLFEEQRSLAFGWTPRSLHKNAALQVVVVGEGAGLLEDEHLVTPPEVGAGEVVLLNKPVAEVVAEATDEGGALLDEGDHQGKDVVAGEGQSNAHVSDDGKG